MWIILRTISFGDTNVLNINPSFGNWFKFAFSPGNFIKHFSVLLELSNGAFFNNQFGYQGISLLLFNNKDKYLNLKNDNNETWGEKSKEF